MPSFPALTPQGQDPGTWASLPSRQMRTQASRFSLCPSSPLKGENPGVQALSLSTFPQHGVEPGGQASPHSVPRLAGHRLAATHLLKRLLTEAASGSGDELRHRAVEISLTSGIICPFTSYVGVRTSQRVTWYQGKERLLQERAVGQLCGMFSFHWSWNPSHRAPPVSWGRPHHHQVLLSHVLNSAPFPVCP